MNATMHNGQRDQERNNTSRLVLVVVLVLVFLMAARTPIDTDLWWHLRAGEETLRSGSPVFVDHYSYTRAGQAWNNHSWLAQVCLAAAFRLGGYLGLGLLVALTVTTALGLVYAQMRGPALLRAFLLALIAAVSAPLWMPRPQVFSLLLFALTGFLIYLYVYHDLDRLLLLPFLFVLWANMHAGYPLGLALLAASIAGQVFDRLCGHAALSWRKTLRMAGWAGISTLAVLVNPGGFRAWLVPFQTVSVGALQTFIQEWASPNFHEISQQPFLWLLLLCLASLGMSGRRLQAGDVFSLLGFTALALMARRNIGPYALAAGPILSRSLWPALVEAGWLQRIPAAWLNWLQQEMSRPPSAPSAHNQVKRGINLGLVAFLGLVAIVKLFTVTHPALVAQAVEQAYPTGAINWLRDHRPNGRLFNSYNWGGYLIWELPEYPVFVDGRTDLFGDQVIGEWITVVQAGAGWQEILDRWDVNLVLLEPDRPLVPVLASAGWSLQCAGEGYVLYGR